jgi:hypothetical protein
MSLTLDRIDQLWGPPTLLFDGYRGSFSGVRRPRREMGHSSPSSAEDKNESSYNSTPPTSLHGAVRDDFTCAFYSTQNEI